jgi:CDGSH-type Zn-finger protein
VEFDGSETASRQSYIEQAEEFDGPTMLLTDVEELCAFARFCDPDGRVWNLIDETDQAEKREIVTHEAGHCAGGRLVAWDKAPRQPLEPALEPSLGLVEDPHLGVSGPIRVVGGIPVRSSDGTTYEVRNRVALCRCGGSSNKPFCDGTHAAINFSDGSAELSR